MTIAFPDVSNHNGAMSLEPGTVACLAKSSEGTGYRDAYYQHYKAEAARVGALFGAYHFLTQGDGARQAGFAYSIVGPDVPMMIDFEPEYDAAGNPISQPSMADAVAFRDTYRELGGNIRLYYLPQWYWSGHLGSPSLAPLADLALVSSHYTGYSDTGPGWASYGGAQPAIWQYTDALSYCGQRVDFNAYRGTVEQFAALLGLSGADMTPDESNMLKQLYDGLFFGGTSMGTTPSGAADNSLVTKLDALSGQLAALSQPRVDAAAVGAALAGDAAFVAAVAAAVAAKLPPQASPDQIAAAVARHFGTDLAAG